LDYLISVATAKGDVASNHEVQTTANCEDISRNAIATVGGHLLWCCKARKTCVKLDVSAILLQLRTETEVSDHDCAFLAGEYGVAPQVGVYDLDPVHVGESLKDSLGGMQGLLFGDAGVQGSLVVGVRLVTASHYHQISQVVACPNHAAMNSVYFVLHPHVV
jgi:hypothetical protein